jgi:hypothetical protein
MSLRDQILSSKDVASTLLPVEIPEWGCTVHVRVMSGKEREKFESVLEKSGGGNVRATLAAFTVCDEDGRPCFTEADVEALNERSSKALDRIYLASGKFNALGKQDLAELEKNSEAATSGATPLASRPDGESSTSTSC